MDALEQEGFTGFTGWMRWRMRDSLSAPRFKDGRLGVGTPLASPQWSARLSVPGRRGRGRWVLECLDWGWSAFIWVLECLSTGVGVPFVSMGFGMPCDGGWNAFGLTPLEWTAKCSWAAWARSVRVGIRLECLWLHPGGVDREVFLCGVGQVQRHVNGHERGPRGAEGSELREPSPAHDTCGYIIGGD